MIIEKDCLFLFKKDLKKNLKITDIDLTSFVKSGLDIHQYKLIIDKSILIVYIDGDNRELKFLKDKGDVKTGSVEKY